MIDAVEPRFHIIPGNWQGMVIICRKCSKRLDGGFGPKGKHSLAKALRKALSSAKGGGGRFGIVEASCLGVCPNGAVTLIDATAPGRWLLVPKGADATALAARIDQARAMPPPASEPQ